MDKKSAANIVEKFGQPQARAAQPEWLLPLRQSGAAAFVDRGFPTLNDEDWRFTNLAALAALPLRPAPPASVNGAQNDVLSGGTLTGLPGMRLVFVNGIFSAKLSRVRESAAGAVVDSLSNAFAGHAAVGGLIREHLGRHARGADNSFAALNQAFFADGAFIHVPENVALTGPVHLIYIASAREGETIQPRNLIIAGRNSRLTVIENFLATQSAPYFTNPVTEIVAGENAIVEHLKFQDEAPEAFHIATIAGQFGRGANVRLHSFALGAKLSRNNIRTRLDGPGLECILNGLYLTRGDQLADHHMFVEHAQPHCASHEYFNGILDDQSKGVFHGRIYVHPAAQKTDAKQTNKNLLLSDEATADTKPQLEIYADDVKCTHGATIGQLNGESIFYLRSRGIPAATARRMLIHAFAGEIVERVRFGPAREALDKVVWDRLETNRHISA
ncbi:MAG: Fe-S cluster assembly protein SufD [Verrucomicrobia bacterium]|nr:Fe-S cluster assembly protein SufD [Verrucomicrobiota bacterium]MDE3099904.1 Fe-S cluster assembly protein SufD [Verrucomicrobiota bacterium]